MKRFHAIVALLLAALWLPTSSHVVLEVTGLIHEEHGHHHHHHDHHQHHGHGDDPSHHSHDSSDHDAADGLCRLASNLIKAPVPSKHVPCWMILPTVETVVETVSHSPSIGRAPPGQAPPELSCQWQFSLRTALPVRAPSLAS